jgi:chromosome partitioning protein
MRNLISNGIKKLVDSGPSYQRGDRAGHVLAVATVKGGVGKTTTSVNLAHGLAKFDDARVLLVDLDAQGHCASSLSAHNTDNESGERLSDVLLDEEGKQVLDVVARTGLDRLHVTPADPELAETEGRIAQKIGKEQRLKESLEITKTHYDYVVVDCPPNRGDLTINGLIAADQVLVPTDLSPLAVQGADELIGTVMTVNDRLGHDLDILGVLLTKVDRRTSAVNDDVLETIQQAWGHLVMDNDIGINTALKKAQAAGKSIFEYDSDCRGATHYRELTREVADQLDSPASLRAGGG